MVERVRPQTKILRIRIEFWIPMATNTHIHAVDYSVLFHCNNGCKNAPHCYVYIYVHCLSGYISTVVTVMITAF